MAHSSHHKIRVAVLFGGKSPEHEVSLVSAGSVMNALDQEKYEVVPVGIQHDGTWVIHPQSLAYLKNASTPQEHVSAPTIMFKPADYANIKRVLDVDVVFPVLHGPYGEDGTIQGFLEMTGIPYVGCGVLASALGMDKITQKRLYQGAGIQTAQFVAVDQQEIVESGMDTVSKNIMEQLGMLCFVKPSNMGSSIGISKVKSVEELPRALEEALKYDSRVLVERAVIEPREIEIAVLGNDPYDVTVPGEIIPSGEFYDYHAKYVGGASELKIPAVLENIQGKHLQDEARKIARLLHITGCARIDFLLSKITNEIFVNEVNTLPGFTSISMYPKLWEATGVAYSMLLDKLITLAIELFHRKSAVTNMYTEVGDWYQH